MLAAQLRAPGFRASEPGYDPEQVRDHLALVHGLVATLEHRIEEASGAAQAAEAAARRAEADTVVDPDDELLAVVFDGQRRADDLLAQAEAEAVRVLREADARVAELRDERELQRLRLDAEAARQRLAETQAAVEAADDDLRTVAEAVRRCREAVGDRLAAALADLAEMEHA